MIIPQGGCDIVLGIQWLETLGPITWNFKKLEMRFMWRNHEVVLHGIKQEFVKEINANKLNKILENQAYISMMCAGDK